MAIALDRLINSIADVHWFDGMHDYAWPRLYLKSTRVNTHISHSIIIQMALAIHAKTHCT